MGLAGCLLLSTGQPLTPPPQNIFNFLLSNLNKLLVWSVELSMKQPHEFSKEERATMREGLLKSHTRCLKLAESSLTLSGLSTKKASAMAAGWRAKAAEALAEADLFKEVQ